MDIAINLDDPRTAHIADVISNKTCKKIIALLAEKELSESEIAKELKMPMNTVGYNIKKLTQAGLIEKSSKFFWSVKGKKIPQYKLSDKKIVISPRKSIKGILPAILFSVAAAAIIKIASVQKTAQEALSTQADSAMIAAETALTESAPITEPIRSPYFPELYNILYNAPNAWVWFLLGALMALAIFMIWNYFKKN